MTLMKNGASCYFTAAERIKIKHFFQDSALSKRPVVCIPNTFFHFHFKNPLNIFIHLNKIHFDHEFTSS